MFERRVGGLGTDIHDGVAILTPSSSLEAPLPSDTLAKAVGNRGVSTLQVLGQGLTADLESGARSKRGGSQETLNLSTVQEVMPLEHTYDGLLRRLGKHTRRNILQCRKWASSNAITFHYSPSFLPFDHSGLSVLASQNMPVRKNAGELLKTIQFATSRQQQFEASLTHPTGKPFSVAGGFIEGDLALMVYQINDRAYRTLNPSLMLRGFLIEHLIERGARHLAFVGGCAGVLNHQCVTVPVAELLLVRKTISAQIRHRVGAMLADTTSRLVRLAPRFIGILALALFS